MNRICSNIRFRLRLSGLCAIVALVSACASDPGEKVVDAPFPNLADVPPRPVAETTPEERTALKQQLEKRRDTINRAAASLLRGGTEPVPVALESQVPEAPNTGGARIPPPPLPAGLPQPPERPEALSDGAVPVNTDASAVTDNKQVRDAQDIIEAPEEAQMPPAKAAGAADESEDADDGDDGD